MDHDAGIAQAPRIAAGQQRLEPTPGITGQIPAPFFPVLIAHASSPLYPSITGCARRSGTTRAERPLSKERPPAVVRADASITAR
jgi:hypothetical protein